MVRLCVAAVDATGWKSESSTKCSGQNDQCSKLVCTRRTTTGRSFNFLLNSLYQRVRRAPFAHRSQETNDMQFRSFAFAFTMGFSATTALFAQAGAVNPALYSDMRWREIGPIRAGRTRALAGVPSQPATFYLGAVNGGVWKTTDAGDTWHSVWDDQPTGSIGSIAVAESDPNVIYVGSGEGLARPDLSVGDGVYKSTDAGKSWVHLGLRDGQQIPYIIVDPRTATRLFVAVLGHPYGPSRERGVYRSTDGGATFENVLS